jgi:quercetin dioxygenase-like cupin family protein
MIRKTTPKQAEKVNAAVDGRIMFSSPRAESILLTLKPGEVIPEHTNPFDVLFIGMEGLAIVISGDQKLELEPKQTLFVTSEEPRQMENHTDNPIAVMVVKIF